MLQVARLAPQVLGDAAGLVEEFVGRERNPDGGFRDRDGRSDLYYTVFGLDAAIALRMDPDPEPTARYLDRFGTGEGLDLVHLCSLVRCRAVTGFPPGHAEALARRLSAFASPDGGYRPHGTSRATAYADFLAWGAWQDLGRTVPDASAIAASLGPLERGDGSWANEPDIPVGSTTATAAAIALLSDHGVPVHPSSSRWLRDRIHAQGGFLATPGAPLPDLLSTATALHALATLRVPFDPFREACLDFLDSLWTNTGSFHGHWQEEHLDTEYTFYSLLALGHLHVG